MQDRQIRALADVIVNYSIYLHPGEVAYIDTLNLPIEFLETLIDSIVAAKGIPIISIKSDRILRKIYQNISIRAMEIERDIELSRMGHCDAYIGVKAPQNISEFSDIPEENWRIFKQYFWEPVHLKTRIPHKKWVTLRWPTPAMAQQAGLSIETFEKLFFSACTVDYLGLSQRMTPLKELMEHTDTIRIVAPHTDLEFSIQDNPVIKGDGHWNLPDGEILVAPRKDSLNGHIRFNAPTIFMGKYFDNVQFIFRDGRIHKATSSDKSGINDILDTDEGARYCGEFAFGLNSCIKKPMRDIIFDEKIFGSIHVAAGNAYPESDNGNRSRIHWDFILLLSKLYGGGKVYCDENLIMKDGRFTSEKLQNLNIRD